MRSINIKDSTKVVADIQWADSFGTHVAAAHEDIGKGHVVFYGDEWITYASVWTGTSACVSVPYNSANDPCYESSAAQVFQIPQLWYDAIRYAAAEPQCFAVSSPGVVR